MSKVKCTDCYMNRGTLCKLGNKNIFNTKKAHKCKDFEAVNGSGRGAAPVKVETEKCETFTGDECAYRFNK